MARRLGIPSILMVAQRLCQLIVQFTPVIIATYPTNTALHAALAAANAACGILVQEAAAVRELGD